MNLEAYLERTRDGEILIRGTRVDLAIIVEAYLQGLSPEEIALNYPTLTLEQAYAAVTYYLATGEAGVQADAWPQPGATAGAPVVARLRAIANKQVELASPATETHGSDLP
jgi:uncharacterized protein (DUF433 family)